MFRAKRVSHPSISQNETTDQIQFIRVVFTFNALQKEKEIVSCYHSIYLYFIAYRVFLSKWSVAQLSKNGLACLVKGGEKINVFTFTRMKV